MKPTEAQKLVAELRTAYPNTTFDADTAKLYQRELRPMSYPLAEKAVQEAIHACKFMPTIAELHQQYAAVREQRAREVAEENRRLERLAEDNLPHVPLKEIPEAANYLAKLHGGERELQLERAADGKCDDCPKEGARYKFFRLGLCSTCIGHRLRVKAQMMEGEAA